jgi:hypothetical protein
MFKSSHGYVDIYDRNTLGFSVNGNQYCKSDERLTVRNSEHHEDWHSVW